MFFVEKIPVLKYDVNGRKRKQRAFGPYQTAVRKGLA